jgi:hypothetical protein
LVTTGALHAIAVVRDEADPASAAAVASVARSARGTSFRIRRRAYHLAVDFGRVVRLQDVSERKENTVQYMLLIYNDESAWAALSEAEREAIVGDYFAFTGEIRESGNFVDGAPLHPTTTATAVRVRDGETLVTDGPFAETKEQLGGFYLVEAADADEAIAIAARIPGSRYGTIEVRPVVAVEAGSTA